jgi:hypothetical protein
LGELFETIKSNDSGAFAKYAVENYAVEAFIGKSKVESDKILLNCKVRDAIADLPVSDLILLNILLFELFPLQRTNWFPFNARATERIKNLSIIFLKFIDNIHQSELRTKVVPFQEKSSFHFVVL